MAIVFDKLWSNKETSVSVLVEEMMKSAEAEEETGRKY